MTKDTSEVVARLTAIIAEFDGHIVAAIDEPGDKWDGFVEVKISDIRKAAALISSLVAENGRLMIEIEAAKAFGGGIFGPFVSEPIREIYRQQARASIGGGNG